MTTLLTAPRLNTRLRAGRPIGDTMPCWIICESRHVSAP